MDVDSELTDSVLSNSCVMEDDYYDDEDRESFESSYVKLFTTTKKRFKMPFGFNVLLFRDYPSDVPDEDIDYEDYEVLTTSELEILSKSVMDNVMDMLHIPTRAAMSVLLRHFE